MAVIPIICSVIKIGQDYWMGLLIAEVYSFITIFVANIGPVSKLYPIVAALTLSGYYESNFFEKMLSLLSMIICFIVSAFLIKEYSKKMEWLPQHFVYPKYHFLYIEVIDSEIAFDYLREKGC